METILALHREGRIEQLTEFVGRDRARKVIMCIAMKGILVDQELLDLVTLYNERSPKVISPIAALIHHSNIKYIRDEIEDMIDDSNKWSPVVSKIYTVIESVILYSPHRMNEIVDVVVELGRAEELYACMYKCIKPSVEVPPRLVKVCNMDRVRKILREEYYTDLVDDV